MLSYGAIATGLLVAGLGYVVALAGRMATAPSAVSGWVGLALLIAGAGLALLGLASIRVDRVRSAAMWETGSRFRYWRSPSCSIDSGC